MKPFIVFAVASFALMTVPAYAAPEFSFGTDNGDYANDGECDDPRFHGPVMTQEVLLSDDILNDASDCEAAYRAGKIKLRGVAPDGTPNFGDDSGEYANDGVCDDMRFKGPGMARTLIQDDIMRDASDCIAEYERGMIELNLK